jgi:hypothetical protein
MKTLTIAYAASRRARRVHGGYMCWSGLKNGELIRVAEENGFEIFLTGDKNLAYTQNLAARRIAIIMLSAIDS